MATYVAPCVQGEHRRVKGMRNRSKTEEVGQRTKSTWPGPPHMGRPHGRVNLAESKHDSQGGPHARAYLQA
ncbi:hypothetical protein F383_36104 [Gossypium arboreum]|uniref:Uncharacterized protein n=1 Tax=Gossypium arboreum TaxID=29729 RepID=A0A0B0N7H5_GOSAR|nr:hypothetical protein F383_36104 [Gossypium arboreum]